MDIKKIGSRDAERRLLEYKKYSRGIRRLLILCGIWPSLHPILQTILSYFAFAMLLITFLGSFSFSMHYISNIKIFTQTIALNISLISSMIKICVCLIHRDDLTSLNTHLAKRFAKDLEYKNYQVLALHNYQIFGKLFYYLTTSVGLTSMSTAVFIPLLALRHGRYVPVLPSKFPFVYESGSSIYWIIQVINMWASFFVWTITSGVDSVFGLYTLQMCGELRILAHKFKNLEVSMNYRENFKECIRRHTLLMRSKDSLERVFGILVIWLAITSAIIQCTLIFQATEVLKTMNIAKILYLVAFIFLKLLQAFAYAWYGNLITEESKICLNAIYNAPWAGSGNRKLMTDVLVVLSQRPLIFRAKGCLNVTMDMFSKIVNTSVSYFFLLQTLESGTGL